MLQIEGDMTERPTGSVERAASFGSFRLFPAQQLLLENGAPVRLGSRALEILAALIEQPGELISKAELMARVWPDTFVDENTLRVHVAALRRALGDGQPGRRYLTNVPGRGYCFVAPVDISEPEQPPALPADMPMPAHNLPISRSRIVGRAKAIDGLRDQLTKQRLVTIVGDGGIGKTTVALALAEALLPTYEHGVRFVDLAAIEDPQFVPGAVGTTLGLALHPEDAIPRLVDAIKDKQMLIVLDSCEHVIEAAASLSEQLLAQAPWVRILATSREALRAEGERVHRLQALDVPTNAPEATVADALTSPAVQLFVERAAAIVEGFELNDAEAPIISDICRKLGGNALAIELAAARVDAFGIQQLAVLLDDRFRILKQGKRTAQPRHRSLTAALDWSYEFLPDAEQTVLRRLSVFAGVFTLDSAIAVAEDGEIDIVETVANLVAKSLVSADVGGAVVLYRLLDTTRAYTIQKLIENREFEACARRHAQHQLDWFKGLEANWQTRTTAEWLVEYGRRIDDLRAALNWAFSPDGDLSVAVSLTAASSALWPALAPIGESLEYIERAIAGRKGASTLTAREETRLLRVLAGALTLTRGPHPFIRKFLDDALEIAEKANDLNGRVQTLLSMSAHGLYAGNYREAAQLAERCCDIGRESTDIGHRLMGGGVAAPAFFYLGEFIDAQRHIDAILNQNSASQQYWLLGFRLGAHATQSNLQWLRGFPDQAMRSVEGAITQGDANDSSVVRMDILGQAACPIALQVGDFTTAERWIAMLLELSARDALTVWNLRGRCLKGMLLLARGDMTGLAILDSALDLLREANFVYLRTMSIAALAQGLAAAGRAAEALAAIDEALELADRHEERWCMSELLRIKGEIVLSGGSGNANETAEDLFLRALEDARRQAALSWELRAAMSLARLWRQGDRAADAGDLLSGVYGRFTEGFGTADLTAARAMLDAFRA
jgi:predicted ATPase/DNA-binding winged helix-turn-helix (wHTH) protein